MFLRSLSLLGFKTFARQTELQFDGGVTAIVGPNGSGKTNIVDAVKWVLGTGQARELRGRKMEEVIYAGGERRPRASFAEVTMLLDNSAGRLPVDYHEVAIKRRVERDGESDYFLNGTRIRRRDLIHLLASTGLTVESYAIIDQHDIEQIVVCSPAERRQLLEEAAQVRGVKARRQEAVQRLQELAANLLRLEDLRSELSPRLEALRVQAAAAREAAEATARLELLKGSIVWEEWREARDAHRKAASQAQGLERRLVEAREQASLAEEEFASGRTAMQAAQDRRLARQQALGRLQLQVSEAEHALRLGEERAESRLAAAEAARASESEGKAVMAAAEALRRQLADDIEQAGAALSTSGDDPPQPVEPDPSPAREARRAADQARRAATTASASSAGVRTRREFLEEQAALLAQAAGAAAMLTAAEAELNEAREHAAAAAEATQALARLSAELEGLEALRPAGTAGRRLGDLLAAEAGYEAALAAVLGPLADALVARDEAGAVASASAGDRQLSALYPTDGPEPREGSIYRHVRCEAGFEAIARRLLGHVILGRDVTLEGVYREPGLVRAGSDPRAAIQVRMAELRSKIAALLPAARGEPDALRALEHAEARVAELRSRAAGAAQVADVAKLLDEARSAEAAALEIASGRQRDAAQAEDRADRLARELEEGRRAAAEAHAAARHREAERARWRERGQDLAGQLTTVEQDATRLRIAAAERASQVDAAARAAQSAAAALPELSQRHAAAKEALSAAELEAPEAEAETAEVARRMVALEEARIDARLKVGTLEGNLGLIAREAELLHERMDEIRLRMPDGIAPEEIPGGKAREREMRALERRLEEIGPTNALAEAECRELEARFQMLADQLDDITSARADLEQLIARLRQEEDSRYEAVFGAVAVNFNEYFSELNPGGKATLRHADGEEGPRSGVEILVQPPRKRLQNVTLLSSGERSLAALAFVLALDEVNPSPFTILDEVDAALDDANVDRFGQMVARLGTQRQFLVITHNHVTMAYASTLYGIHLDESGSSHLVSVRLEDIRKPASRSSSAAQAG